MNYQLAANNCKLCKIYNIEVYSLDIIISVGYRVNSLRATQFRRSTTKVLKDYIQRGFALKNSKVNMKNIE